MERWRGHRFRRPVPSHLCFALHFGYVSSPRSSNPAYGFPALGPRSRSCARLREAAPSAMSGVPDRSAACRPESACLSGLHLGPPTRGHRRGRCAARAPGPAKRQGRELASLPRPSRTKGHSLRRHYPETSAGLPPALSFSRPARRSLALQPAHSLSRPTATFFHRSASVLFVIATNRSECYRLERTSCRAGLPPSGVRCLRTADVVMLSAAIDTFATGS